MTAELLPDGRLRVPRRAEGPGGLLGDGSETIGPEHPDWAAWVETLTPADREKLAARS